MRLILLITSFVLISCSHDSELQSEVDDAHKAIKEVESYELITSIDELEKSLEKKMGNFPSDGEWGDLTVSKFYNSQPKIQFKCVLKYRTASIEGDVILVLCSVDRLANDTVIKADPEIEGMSSLSGIKSTITVRGRNLELMILFDGTVLAGEKDMARIDLMKRGDFLEETIPCRLMTFGKDRIVFMQDPEIDVWLSPEK